MLRPATPLTVLLLVSFVLLLISVISTPIVNGIPLATYEGYNFGVFGYCSSSRQCSGIQLGYTTDGLFTDNGDFNLPSGARNSLSYLLIVHPIAAFCNLVALALAAAAHFHSPSHSARYLLGLLILLFPTLLITLLAFLVDILLFVPHMQWGGWLVLASTILIAASGVVTCAMRRTLVSRKARKKRIAENAEMSGENFYARQAAESKFAAIPTVSTESKHPLVNGAPGADTLPAFTSYDGSSRREMPSSLNTQNTPIDVVSPISPVNADNRYYGSASRSNSRPPPTELDTPYESISPQRSIPGPGPDAGMYATPTEQRRTPANYPPNAYPGRGGYGPPRGRGGGGPSRGGYAPRGGYGPRGPSPQRFAGRGGFNPEMRGAYNGRGRGGYPTGPMAPTASGGIMAHSSANRRVPPPRYPPQGGEDIPLEHYGPSSGTPAAHMGRTTASPYPQSDELRYEPISPSDYGPAENNNYTPYNRQAPAPVSPVSPAREASGSRRQSPAGGRRAQSPAPEMPPMIGQAVAMDGSTGRSTEYGSQGERQFERSQQEYVAPRAQWSNPSPVSNVTATHNPRGPQGRPQSRVRASSAASSSYYEDVDPRFAEPVAQPPLPEPSPRTEQAPHLLSVHPHHYHQQHHSNRQDDVSPLPQTSSYEDLPRGARSPAESDGSQFTSISQRGVNPNWRPGHGGEFNSFGPPRRTNQSQMRQDVLLAGNPDFEIPGMGPAGRAGPRMAGGGMREGSSMAMGANPAARRMLPPSALGLGGDGRYPEPVMPNGSTVREF